MYIFAQNLIIFLFFYFVIRAATPFFWVGDPLFFIFWTLGEIGAATPHFWYGDPQDSQKSGFPGLNVPWPA